MKISLLILSFILAGFSSPLLSQESNSPPPQALQSASSPQRAYGATWAHIFDDAGDPSKGWVISNAIIPTFDGGYAVVGSANISGGAKGGWVMKLDPLGSFLWQKVYAIEGEDVTLQCIQETSDGGLIVFGSVAYYCNLFTPCSDYIALFLDTRGDIAWQKRYHEDLDLNIHATGVGCFETQDHGFIFVADAWLAAVDSFGELIWQKRPVWGSYSAYHTREGNILISGGYKGSLIVKVDKSGNIIFGKYVESLDSARVYGFRIGAATETSDGDFIIAGSTDPFSENNDVIFFKLSSSFALRHQWKINNLPYARPFAIYESANQAFVIAIRADSYEVYGSIFLKISDAGHILWQNVYAGLSLMGAGSALPLVAGGGITTGFYVTPEYGDAVIAVKFGTDGLISEDCAFIQDTYFSLEDVEIAVINGDFSFTEAAFSAIPAEVQLFEGSEIDIPLCAGSSRIVSILPAAASISGAQGTHWLTDVMILNPNVQEAVMNIVFTPAGENGADNPYVTQQVISGGSAIFSANILSYLFSLTDTAGSLRIESQLPVVTSSRTYNEHLNGTFGQYIPSFDRSDALSVGENAYLIGLQLSDSYRSNIGFSESFGQTTTVLISFYDSAGMRLSESALQVPPYSWLQRALPELILDGKSSSQVSYAKVQVLSGGGVIAYASIIDNRTGDAVFTASQKPGLSANERIIPVVARIAGDYGTNWRSDLCLANVSASFQPVIISLETSGGSYPYILEIQPFNCFTITDFVSSLYPWISGDVVGWINIECSGQVLITSRTYNLTDQGTYGQYVPAMRLDHGLKAREVGFILQLRNTAIYRCNMGFSEALGIDSQILVQVFGLAGIQLAEKTYIVPANRNIQINGIFQEMGIEGSCDAAFATVTILSGGNVYAYASIVDNRTGDAIFVPAIMPF